MDGMEILQEMKEHDATRNIPALFLTARSELDDRLEGLRLGADDYVTKPFSSKELVLRVRNLLHRASNSASRVMLQYKELCLDKLVGEADGQGHNPDGYGSCGAGDAERGIHRYGGEGAQRVGVVLVRIGAVAHAVISQGAVSSHAEFAESFYGLQSGGIQQ